MNFCDDAIGLSGVICGVIPRLVLCRTVMNVVAALTRTVIKITTRPLLESGNSVGGLIDDRNLSATVTPKMCACCALVTTDLVSPYMGWSWEIARSTPNSAKNTGSCAAMGRQPASGLAPFSLWLGRASVV